jgi:WD40 repeat protein
MTAPQRMACVGGLFLFAAFFFAATEAAEKDLPNKAGWHVEEDPAPQIKGPFNTTDSIPVAFQGHYIFPSIPSAFVAVTPPKTKDVYQVYDLRTMKPVGKPITLKNRFSVFTRPALSPDGKHLAVRVKQDASSTIEVWSVESGKSVRRLPLETDDRVKPKYFDLLGKDRLQVAKHRDEFPRYTVRTTFQTWNIETGKEVSKFTNPLVPDGRWFTFSGGGRYQWMEQTGGWFLLLVWDMNTGKMVGEREFQGQKDTWGIAAGLAVSPDGKEVAMLWQPKDRGKTFGRLLCWEVKTGKKLFDHTLANEWPEMAYLGTKGGAATIQWWPERSGWLLFGHLLVDRDSGKVVHKIGKPPLFTGAMEERRFLDRDHVTTLEGTFDKKLEVIALPRKEIDDAVKKARAGKAGD